MTKIKINVFNLTPLNKVFSWIKVGVYHTSLVIADRFEYYYGFADWGYTGVDSPEKVNELPSCMTGTFHSSYEIGETDLSVHDCREIARAYKRDPAWLSDRYNFLYHNCNTFTRDLCETLVGIHKMSNYPTWVTRGEKVGMWLYSTSLSHVFLFCHRIPGLAIPIELDHHREPSFDESTEPADADIESAPL